MIARRAPDTWSLHVWKFNGGNPGWFVTEHVQLSEMPQAGDVIDVGHDRYRVRWVNDHNRSFGVGLAW